MNVERNPVKKKSESEFEEWRRTFNPTKWGRSEFPTFDSADLKSAFNAGRRAERKWLMSGKGQSKIDAHREAQVKALFAERLASGMKHCHDPEPELSTRVCTACGTRYGMFDSFCKTCQEAEHPAKLTPEETDSCKESLKPKQSIG